MKFEYVIVDDNYMPYVVSVRQCRLTNAYPVPKGKWRQNAALHRRIESL